MPQGPAQPVSPPTPVAEQSTTGDRTVDGGLSHASVETSPPLLPTPATVVPAWAIHRRMYDWVLGLAHTRHGTLALFLLSFAESSFFPVPPDVLQIALTLEKRSKAFYYAFINTLGSVLGGIAGYAIGWGLWSMIDVYFYKYIASAEKFHHVELLYQKYDFWCVFAAAFTPIPYKVFTISAGVFHVSLLMFIVASIIGRGARFFIVAGLLYTFGPPIKTFIERYFNLLTLVFMVLVAVAIVAFKVLK